MEISAQVHNGNAQHIVSVSTNSVSQMLNIPAKSQGQGSAVNGGELLFLAMATCYCNDIYREAARINIEVRSVAVQVSGTFGQAGEAAQAITYNAQVTATASETDIFKLMHYTDTVAEIHNTLRQGMPVSIGKFTAISEL